MKCWRVSTLIALLSLGGCGAFRQTPEMSFEYGEGERGTSISCSRGERKSAMQQIAEVVDAFESRAKSDSEDATERLRAAALAICIRILTTDEPS